MWFIATLIMTKIIFCMLWDHKLKGLSNHFFFSIFLSWGIFVSAANEAFPPILPLCLDNVKFAVLFYAAGVFVKRIRIVEWLQNRMWLLCSFTILCLFNTVYMAEINGISVMMHKNDYGNYLYFFMGAFSGIFTLTNISLLICKDKFLDKISAFFGYFGKDTLYFFVMQFIVIDVVRVFLNRFIRITASVWFNTGSLYVITIIILIPINILLRKYLSNWIDKQISC